MNDEPALRKRASKWAYMETEGQEQYNVATDAYLAGAREEKERALDQPHTTSCGHTWTMRHTACPECFAALRAEIAEQAAEIAKLQEAVRAIAPKRCEDCEGAGDLGRAGESALARLVACESCGGHEDRRGAGYVENQDVEYAEWMARPEVRRAIYAKSPTEPGGEAMSDDADRRKRAEEYLNGAGKITFEDSTWARGLAGGFDDDYGVLLGYLAGAREEAEIKDAQIASIRAEVIATWRAMQGVGQSQAYRIMERMVDRLGYGRTDGNPSLAQVEDE